MNAIDTASPTFQIDIATCPTKAQERFCGVVCVETESRISADILAAYDKDFAGRGHGGWRAVGEILGVSGGTAYEVAHGQRTLTNEQTLRWRVFQETIGRDNPKVRMVQTLTCPSCGQLHQVPDCHGQAGEVVIIAVAALPSAKPKRLRKDTLTLRLDPTRCGSLTTEEMRQAIYWEADHMRRD